jgi:RND family efflux transporter MFP subunit
MPPPALPGPRTRTIGRQVIVAAAVLVLGVGCHRGGQQSAAPKAPEVYVSQPVTREITDSDEFTGRTYAFRSVDVRARVTGYLNKVNFKEGADVKEGDILFEIDPRTYQALFDAAKAQAGVAEANLKSARDKNERVKALAKQGPSAVSPQDIVDAQSMEDQAAANWNVTKANLETAQLNLNFCKVIAPLAGRVSNQRIDPGNLVKQDDTVLTSIVAIDPIYVFYDVDERSLLHFRRLLRAGKIQSARDIKYPVELALADEEGFPHKGTINFVDNQVDPTTGTLRIRADFPNPDKFMSPGQFARVRIPVGSPHPALLVADRALGTDQGQKFVYVVNGKNEVEYRKVRVGMAADGLRVIEEGLSAGERVVVTGLQRVRQGAKVEPREVAMTTPPGARPGEGKDQAPAKGG